MSELAGVRDYALGLVTTGAGLAIGGLVTVSGFLFRSKLKSIDENFKRIEDWHEKAVLAQGEFAQVKLRIESMADDYGEILRKQADIYSQQKSIIASVEEIHKTLVRKDNEERRR